ncbi:hypothetical protein [Halobellus rubicundus]|uniref:Rpa-associated protein n=1 Tax=Halobellus rubicundus TaxID=2996466 RepID=A0ABD5M9Z7_9EURY
MSDAPQGREVARRVFAAEFDDATLSYSESDEERAPNYVVTPTGARINRLFAVGALTEVESVNDDIVRGRIADPTGVFVSYAGQYQPDAMGFLERAEPPCFVSLTGKARTYQPDDSDRIFTSVRPESLNEVDADTRDRWVVAAAEATLERVATTAAALDLDVCGDDLRAALESRGVDAALAQGVALAIDHYEPTEHYLEAVRTMAIQGLELVAGEREAVDGLAVDPDEAGPDELGPLPDVAAASAAPADATATAGTGTEGAGAADEAAEATGSTASTASEPSSQSAADESEPTVETSESPTADESEAQPAAETAAADVSDQSAPAEVDSEGSASADAESTATEDPSPSDSVDGPGDFDGADEGDEPDAPAESAADETTGSDELGDFGVDAGGADPDDIETGIDEGEMYELDPEERAEIEAEYGTEFATGNEVSEPGEADIDVPDVDELEAEAGESDEADATPSEPAAPEPTAESSPAEETADADVESADVAGEGAGDGTATEDDPEPAVDDSADDLAADAADVDLEDAAVAVMENLDDGDGADREAVIAAVVEEYGADPDDVEDAIQEALMSGQCYEPNEGTLKAI